MLREFVVTHRQAIIDRARQHVTGCQAPSPPASKMPNGVAQFLAHLSMALQSTAPHTSLVSIAIAAGGMHQGRALLGLDYSLSQVVRHYGDIGRAITELAMERRVPITTQEFHTLSCLLDTAIAEAVTEHARLTAESRLSETLERSVMVSREIHGMVDTALVALDTLEQGTVTADRSMSAVLAQSLINLRNFVDSALSVVRVDSHHDRLERILVATFLDEVALAEGLVEKHRGLQFTVAPVDDRLTIVADPQLLASAVTNLLNNAFKYTHDHGRVTLRAFAAHERLLIEVEDECGGLPESSADPLQPLSERRAVERSGRGLGLANARKAVRAQGGEIHTRNIRGKGCVFVIEVPLGIDQLADAPPPTAASQPAVPPI